MKKSHFHEREKNDDIEPEQCQREQILPQTIEPRNIGKYNNISALTKENAKLKRVLREMSELLLDSEQAPHKEPSNCIEYMGNIPVEPLKQEEPPSNNICQINTSRQYMLNLLRGKRGVTFKVPKRLRNCYITIQNAPCTQRIPRPRRNHPEIEQSQEIQKLLKRIEDLQVPQQPFDEYGMSSPYKTKPQQRSYILNSEKKHHKRKLKSISDHQLSLPNRETPLAPPPEPVPKPQSLTKSKDEAIEKREAPLLNPRGKSGELENTSLIDCSSNEIRRSGSFVLEQERKESKNELSRINLADYMMNVPILSQSPVEAEFSQPQPVLPSIPIKKPQKQITSTMKMCDTIETPKKESIYVPPLRKQWKVRTCKLRPLQSTLSQPPPSKGAENDKERLKNLDEKISLIKSFLGKNRTVLPKLKNKSRVAKAFNTGNKVDTKKLAFDSPQS